MMFFSVKVYAQFSFGNPWRTNPSVDSSNGKLYYEGGKSEQYWLSNNLDIQFLRSEFNDFIIEADKTKKLSLLECKINDEFAIGGYSLRDHSIDTMDVNSSMFCGAVVLNSIIGNESFVFGSFFYDKFGIHSTDLRGNLWLGRDFFYGNVAIEDVEIKEELYFGGSNFSKNLTLRNVKLFEPMLFDQVGLPDTLVLHNVDMSHLTRDVFLNNARLRISGTGDPVSKCTLVLSETNIERLVLDYSKFSLGFDESTPHETRVSIYQQVIRKCRDVGLENSAIGFDIDLQKMSIREKWGPLFSPVVIGFQDNWWGFGYERDKIFYNILLSYYTSFLLVLAFFKSVTSTYFPADFAGLDLKSTLAKDHNTRWYATVKVSFIYAALVFFGWKMNHSEVRFHSNFWAAALIYLIYVTGLVHLAYLAAFVIVT